MFKINTTQSTIRKLILWLILTSLPQLSHAYNFCKTQPVGGDINWDIEDNGSSTIPIIFDIGDISTPIEQINSVTIRGYHQYSGDLAAELIPPGGSPQGTTASSNATYDPTQSVILFRLGDGRYGEGASNCGRADFDLTFTDNSPGSDLSQDDEGTYCTGTNNRDSEGVWPQPYLPNFPNVGNLPALNGNPRTYESQGITTNKLSNLVGQNPNATWGVFVEDAYSRDVGTLTEVCLDMDFGSVTYDIFVSKNATCTDKKESETFDYGETVYLCYEISNQATEDFSYTSETNNHGAVINADLSGLYENKFSGTVTERKAYRSYTAGTGIVPVGTSTLTGSITIEGSGSYFQPGEFLTTEETVIVTVNVAPIVPNDDSGTATSGVANASVITDITDNDTLNGQPAQAGPGGNAIISENGTWPAGFSLDPNTGAVSVDATVPAGAYTMDYELCEAGSPTNCETATITITVSLAVIDAIDNDFNTVPVNGGNGGTTPTVIMNDTLDGTPNPVIGTNPGEITLQATGTAQDGSTTLGLTTVPANGSITMNAAGELAIAANTSAGTYTYVYEICEVTNTDNCDTAIATVNVSTIAAIAETFLLIDGVTGGTTASVLTSDTLNDNLIMLPSEVLITVGAVTGGLTLNSSSEIVVPASTSTGSYTLEYTICDAATGTICDTVVETVNVAVKDYGDAPTSYGDSGHIIFDGSSVYLGSNVTDGESQAQNTANGGSDGTGDDKDGNNDEDGVRLNGTTLQDQTINNDAPLTLTITVGGAGQLHGWIDWDGDGVFGNNPNELVVSETTAASGTRSILITPPNSLTPGSSYARFRYSADPAAATPTGEVIGGEVEDYRLTLDYGFNLYGRVYNDTNVNAVSDIAEPGISGVAVVLYDFNNPGSCVSTLTDTNGNYVFTDVIPGDYQIYEAADELVPTPQNCDPANTRDPNGYLSTTANDSVVFTVTNSNVTNINFGDIRPPSFELDNTQTIQPNSTVIHPHVFTANSDGIVSFTSNTEVADPAVLNWGRQLLLDSNCDGQLDTMPATITVTAGQKLCVNAKVIAPANASTNASHTLQIQSDFTYGDGSILNNDLQTREDLTIVLTGTTTAPALDPMNDPVGTPDPVAGEGKLSLVKSVFNVTQSGINNGATALPGDTLRYSINYQNIGNGPLNALIVQDSVPESTRLVPASMLCIDTPPELPVCATDATNSSLTWSWAVTDELLPGSQGSVSYDVVVK